MVVTKRRKSSRLYRGLRACFFMSLPALALCLVILAGIVWYIWRVRTWDLYSAEDVRSICRQLDLDPSDEFCTDPTSQFPSDLERMLKRNFPQLQTTYDDINRYIPLAVSSPLPCDYERTNSFIFPSGECPPPRACQAVASGLSDVYGCHVIFAETSVGVTLYFNSRNGVIKNYSADYTPDI